MSPSLSRRRLLTGAGALGLGALLAACGGTDDEGGAAPAAAGPWAFTDDRGTKVTAPGTPKRIVAYVGSAAALKDFGVDSQLVGVFGPSKASDGSKDPLAGDLDVAKVTSLGNAWGEFNIEKYATLQPELLVTNTYEPPALWYVPDDSKDKIAALAPSVAIKVAGVSLAQVLARYGELAASLGADQNAKLVTDAKARFEAAAAAVRDAVKANGGLKVLAGSASADLFYVSTPKIYADLSYYQELGVEVIVPDNVTGGFFENLSWETVDKYKADVILLDSRTSALQPKDLTAKPTWAALPAVKAGQVVPWQSEPRFSHAGCAGPLEALGKALAAARKVSA
ncbi:ABC transporter substrate-binding protein [Dactylosporangium sucinum]|uniref:ABC transporter substrate-binding protein n=1 Tax=Dactylosporangium sucinum TaxID=1424081 RepID=A0A917U331_9ACTN|nr:ABC transporter substrate-binding protein [Dactylosporangium sucinum]GGM54167.1 ABC transporter substrate-binding protein [Dactylosporangium sucinum]